MKKVELRYQRVSDAKRFYKILNNPNFTWFRVCPESIETQKDFLRQNRRKRKEKREFNYAILYEGKLAGGCGLRIDQFRKFQGEIGYFVDENYWGMGIAAQAVMLLEKIGFNDFGLVRIEILMHPENLASEKVALKCGYTKEGSMKKAIQNGDEMCDCHLYAKTI
jgi:ribosomal-protein-alanine N-acetyltransferase